MPIYGPYEDYCAKKQRNIQLHLNNLPSKQRGQLAGFLREYCDGRKISIPTRESYVRSLSYFAKSLKATDFKAVRQPDIEKYLERMKHKEHNSNSIQDWAKISLKVFYRWLLTGKTGKRDAFPPIVSWISIGYKKAKKVRPEDCITPEEFKAMLGACRDAKERAFLQLLLDTGGRLGEILNVRIKDVHLEAQLPYIEFAKSKTEPRPVYLMDSVQDVRAWMQQHPNKRPDSYLFVPLKTERTKSQFWQVDNAYQALQRIAVRAGLKKKIWPHLFRHTSATLERKISMPDQLMNLKFGWSENSRMAARYSHITSEDVAKFQLRARGVKVEDANPRAPIECKKCKQKNAWNLDYCGFCAYPLKDHLLQEAKAQEMKKEKEHVQILARLEKLEKEKIGRVVKRTRG